MKLGRRDMTKVVGERVHRFMDSFVAAGDGLDLA